MSFEIGIALAALMFTVLTTIVSGAAAVIAWLVRKNESLQDAALMALRSQVGEVASDVEQLKAAVGRYEGHVGAGDARLEGIEKSLSSHVEREEQIFWKKVEAISDAQRVSNEAILQRITSIEARMPNGELKELMKAVARLEVSVDAVRTDLTCVAKHVEQHEAESVTWNQRIMQLEAAEPAPRKRK